MFAASMWVVLGSFLAAGAQSTAYLYSGRFFTGLGVGSLSAIGYAFRSEMLDFKHR
jgi:MFS family permease